MGRTRRKITVRRKSDVGVWEDMERYVVHVPPRDVKVCQLFFILMVGMWPRLLVLQIQRHILL